MSSLLKKLQKDPPEAEERTPPGNGRVKRRLFKRAFIFLAAAVLLGCLGTLVVVETWPSVGAQAAIGIRGLFGPRAVARLENIVFQAQDAVKKLEYRFSDTQAEIPWEPGSNPTTWTPTIRVSSGEAASTPEPAGNSPTPSPTIQAPAGPEQPAQSGEQTPGRVASPPPTPAPHRWELADLPPFGTLEGEGTWEPYLYDREGGVVAARTFLQPDPERPYTIVAVVAFDLNRTRLHFVLGFNEPSLPDGPRGDGLIPENDREGGGLLAAFNGGFRAANGQFGAMADGIEALPPKDGYATVAIYRSGEVRIGNWRQDIEPVPDLLAWRQNCQLVVQDGEVSPRVYSNSITDWGASISNQIVTRRSGLGLDQAGKTLYYFAGPSLSMPVLADSMLVSGVHDGMLLDINHFWVHFTAIRSRDGQLVAEPLLPRDMIDHIDRYLGPSPADFFYVTVLGDP